MMALALMIAAGCTEKKESTSVSSSSLPPSETVINKDLKSFFVSALPAATVGNPYFQPIALIDQESAKNYTLTADPLPAGMIINGMILAGVPQTSGQCQIKFSLGDNAGNKASEEYTLSIYADLTILSDSLVPATVGKPYKKADGGSFKIEAVGGSPPYQFSIMEGALSEGLELSPGEGIILGTAVKIGQYSFTVNVADSLGANSTRSFTFLTNDALSIVASSALEPAAERSNYEKLFYGEGGSPSYIWSALGKLPAGLNFTERGLLRGVPEKAENYKFILQVTDQIGNIASREYQLNVQPYTRPIVNIGWGRDTSLSDASAGFGGEAASFAAGKSVSGVGDVNGDGHDDFIIGAGHYGNVSGKAYLFLGKASAPNDWFIDDCTINDASASFKSETGNDWVGSSTAGVGDVNGDGYDDFLIGAFRNASDTGKGYLILGKAVWTAKDYPTGDLNTPLSQANASFVGENAGDKAFNAIAGAGDVNGDGYDDFLIGAANYNYSGPGYAIWRDKDGNVVSNCAGQAYLILGKAAWTADADYPAGDRKTPISQAYAKFLGEQAGDIAGGALAGVGDINKDGYDDFIIGASGYANFPGKAYLFMGKSSANWGMRNLSTADASFIGRTDEHAGSALAGAGDANGDTYDDFLIGASLNDDGGQNAGGAYLILGREKTSADWWGMNANLGGEVRGKRVAAASFIGEAVDDRAGSALAGVGDVNGDGYDDFLIGANLNDDGGKDAGKTYLILGKKKDDPNWWGMKANLGGEVGGGKVAAASFIGEAAGDYAGSSLAGVGDVDGNGYSDLLIGAYGSSRRANGAGEAYIVFIPKIIP